ncbi:MAG: SdrD B-like domain-containing protein [Candidatus Eremiobacterota bacterium]
MMIKLLFLILLICLSSNAFAGENNIFCLEGTILGKVYLDENNNGFQDEGEKGIEGVVIILENGITVITGADGKYSVTNLKGGFHVLKLDDWTLPPGIILITEEERCKFINLPAGGSGHVDFIVKEDL